MAPAEDDYAFQCIDYGRRQRRGSSSVVLITEPINASGLCECVKRLGQTFMLI